MGPLQVLCVNEGEGRASLVEPRAVEKSGVSALPGANQQT